MYLGPDESDEEQDDGHQEDNEYRHMIRVVKVSKDELKVDGIHGLEEAGSVAGEMVCLTLCPDPHIVLEEYLERNTSCWGKIEKLNLTETPRPSHSSEEELK